VPSVARYYVPRAAAALVLILFFVFFGLPLVWLVLASSKTYYQLQTEFPLSLGSWQGLETNWNQLLSIQGGAFLGWLRNSAFYSLGGLALMLLTSIPAGYAMAKTRFRLRKQLLMTTLVVMLMPSTALVLPVFLELNGVGLIGNPLSVILPFAFFPFGVYLTYIHFNTAVPAELLAAARIDGCSELQVFLRVAVPLAAPVIALVAFFNFVQSWTNYFLPFVVLPSSDGYTVQVGLSTVGRSPSPLAVVVATIPVVLLFLAFQRFVLSGKTTGALAGD
jgi:multiple sugar transport system permease protein